MSEARKEEARCIWCGQQFTREDPRIVLCGRCAKGVPR